MKTKRRRSSFCLAAVALSLLTLRVGQGASPINHQISLPAGMSWCDDGMINGLFTQVNTTRSQNGVAALSMNTLGMKDAEIRATQFASYMTTNPPGSPGFNPHLRIRYDCCQLGVQDSHRESGVHDHRSSLRRV